MASYTTLIKELNHEASGTRKMLERLPGNQLNWAPHPKSKTLGQLAAHVAETPRWINHIMKGTEFDMQKDTFDRVKSSDKEEIVTAFEQVLKEAVDTLENATEEQWENNWVFKSGNHIVFGLPRHAAIRTMVMNHLIHHRGQLSVYLRLLNVPVPGMYGPTADER